MSQLALLKPGVRVSGRVYDGTTKEGRYVGVVDAHAIIQLDDGQVVLCGFNHLRVIEKPNETVTKEALGV